MDKAMEAKFGIASRANRWLKEIHYTRHDSKPITEAASLIAAIAKVINVSSRSDYRFKSAHAALESLSSIDTDAWSESCAMLYY